MSESDVRMARLLSFAYSLACGVAQDVETREIVLFSPHFVQTFPDVVATRAFLRLYATCGTYGRRCFHSGCQCDRLLDAYVPASVSLPL